VPAKILEIDDIPYTISGKKVEIAVKKIINGEKINNKDALANPQSLDLYRNIKELQ
jgi:acetoacetyl-CoA synthetase